MAQEKVGIKIEVDGSEGTKAVGNIRKEIKQATVALEEAQAQFGEYSAEAIAAAKKVAELRDRVSEAAETARLFDPGKSSRRSAVHSTPWQGVFQRSRAH